MSFSLIHANELTSLDLLIRIFVAVLIGCVVGTEREYKNRPAGLRTHVLVCLGACMIALAEGLFTANIDTSTSSNVTYNFGRLCAQVISGIGFLGAGTIIITRHNQVKGLTTAATLWATACMGLAVGVGFYECALVMYVLLIFVLVLVSVLDNRYLKIPTSAALYLEVARAHGLGDAIANIHELGWHVREVKEFPSGREGVLAVRMDLESEDARRGDVEAIALLRDRPGVIRLEM